MLIADTCRDLADCECSATRVEVEVEFIRATHFLPVPDRQLRDSLWLNPSFCEESNLGCLPRCRGWTSSSHSPVLWHPRLALSSWWHHNQRPMMHHTADLETEDQAEVTQGANWSTRVVTQNTRNSILARHECRNHYMQDVTSACHFRITSPKSH